MKLTLLKVHEADEDLFTQLVFVESSKSSKKGDANIAMKMDKLPRGEYLIVF
jgi:hypothetical protein